MDFVTLWKASSIVLTGAFGILGLIKDYKDKKTGKITVWGRVSLTGILLSSGLGVVAQLKESSDEERAKASTAQQTLALAKKTDITLLQLQRTLSMLDQVHLFVEFDVPCESKKYKEFCQVSLAEEGDVRKDEVRRRWWLYWPSGRDHSKLSFAVHFFTDEKVVEAYASGGGGSDWEFSVSENNYSKHSNLDVFRYPETKKVTCVLDIAQDRFQDIYSDGKIKSKVDLAGATVVVDHIDGKQGEPLPLTPVELMIFLKDQDFISAEKGTFQKFDVYEGAEDYVLKQKGFTAYRARMKDQ